MFEIWNAPFPVVYTLTVNTHMAVRAQEENIYAYFMRQEDEIDFDK
jgi:hypothetical protein